MATTAMQPTPSSVEIAKSSRQLIDGAFGDAVFMRDPEVSAFLRTNHQCRSFAMECLRTIRQAFPDVRLRVDLNQDPDDDSFCLSFTAYLEEPTREDRRRAALLHKQVHPGDCGLSAAFSVERRHSGSKP